MKKGIILLAMLVSGQAAAEQAYFGVGIGQSDVDELNDTDTALKAFMGVHVNPNLSLEGGIVSFGEVSDSAPDVYLGADASAVYGALVGRLSVGAATVYGKVGLQYWDVEMSSTVQGYYGSGSETGIDPMFGVGLEVPVADRVAVRAEFERYQNVSDGLELYFPAAGEYLVSNGTDVDVLSVSATYSF